MMLYKPIVSLIVAIAAASSTAASATPLRRGNGYYPPPQVPAIPLNECNANSQAQCCNSYTSSANPAVTSALQGLNLLGLSDTLVGAGLSCKGMVQVAAGATCNPSTTALCCKNTVQNGLVNVGCSPIILPAL